VTKDGGKSFKLYESWATKCIWARDASEAILCTSYQYKNGNIGQDRLGLSDSNPQKLYIISDDGKDSMAVLDLPTYQFFFAEDMLVTLAGEGQKTHIFTTKNVNSKPSKISFPRHLNETAYSYTVLLSRTSGIYVHAVNHANNNVHSYGTLFKSDERGLFFSKVLDYCNKGASNRKVDLELMPEMQGILFANVVTNYRSLDYGVQKQIESLFSFDDGFTWQSIAAPPVDSNGVPITCKTTNVIVTYSEVPPSFAFFF
jgi:hypothetical protein